MTEWWVSQKKNWCEICRVWTGGHIQQILKHKGGRMHIEHEEKMLKDAREREKGRQKDEVDLKDQLEAIERAAAKAMQESAWQAPSNCSATGSTSAPGTADEAARREREKAAIENTVAAASAKRQRLDQGGAEADGPGTGPDNHQDCPWTRHTDPNSGVHYYYNATSGVSSWTETEEFAASRQASAAATAHARLAPAAAVPEPTPQAAVSAGVPGVATSSAIAATHQPNSAATYMAAAQAKSQAKAKGGGGQHRLKAQIAADAAADAMILKHYEAQGSAAACEVVAPAAAESAAAQAGFPISQSAAVPGSSGWVVCTDPNSGSVYYHNAQTGQSTWERPPDLGIDIARPPPPPPSGVRNQKPGAPGGSAAGVGQWEEVKPEESVFEAPAEVDSAAQESSAQANACGGADGLEPGVDNAEQLSELRYQMMGRKGEWADEDRQFRGKEMCQKNSNAPTGESASKAQVSAAFSSARKRVVALMQRQEDNE